MGPQVGFQSSPGSVAGCDGSQPRSCISSRMFQSSPGSVAGCDAFPLVFPWWRKKCFNPHPARWPGATSSCPMAPATARCEFQSSPGSVAGCDKPDLRRAAQEMRFQSSPGSVAGCDGLRDTAGGAPDGSFNPHPARWPGATGDTQPTDQYDVLLFQSSPGSVAGCDTSAGTASPLLACWFQSSPGSVAGCDYGSDRLEWPPRVVFQSSPGSVAGCDRAGPSNPTGQPWGFNPHPARWPGATPRPAGPRRFSRPGFNPHPARWPGATSPDLHGPRPRPVSILTRLGGRVRPQGLPRSARTSCPVSILTRLGGRVRRLDEDGLCYQDEVSILTRLGGRVRRKCARAPHHTPRWCFNPHPARWPGATRRNDRRIDLIHQFQSSPGSVAGCDVSDFAFQFDGQDVFQSSPGSVAGCDESVAV